MIMNDQSNYAAWNALAVGVANLDMALELWVEQFGFNVVSAKRGDDSELARLWSLQADDIAQQALVRCNNSRTGALHLVEFNQPDAPVRRNAENFDLVPKSLDLYVKDLPKKVDELRSAGYVFRTKTYSEFTAPDGTQFREIHLPSHDDVNVVLVEVVGKEYDYTQAGVAGVGPLVLTVPDVVLESEFIASTFLLEKLNENVFEGAEIEKVVGLPRGTVLKICIWGQHGHELGELEIVEYQGVNSNNLYPRAKPKALGILQAAYVSTDTTGLQARLQAQGVSVTQHGQVDTLIGSGQVLSFVSPAGFKVEVYEQRSGV